MLRLLVATILLGTIGLPSRAEEEPPVPKELAVPAGHKQVVAATAKGVQIYKAVEGKGGKLEWELEAPLAEMVGGKGERIGCHFEGPAWEAVDGSRVVRDKTEDVKVHPAPKPASDIPWLLVRVKSDDTPSGTLTGVSYVQRLATQGGKPPAEAPKRVGTKIGVPYAATYLFYAPGK